MSFHIRYDLSGAVAVITGGGQGIGKAIARALAADWAADNLCANASGPGSTRTEFDRPLWTETERAGEYLGAVPKNRVAEPEEIVGAVLFCPRMRTISSPASPSTWTAAIGPRDLFPE